MRFVVDGMLGGLARWLRMLGYETEYEYSLADNTLLQRSQSKETILLTRDEELHKRAKNRSIASVLVVGDSEDARLALLAKELGISLDIDMSSTRCPECGATLVQISKDDASKVVPETSRRLYEQFRKCSNQMCAKTYWEGSHWKRIRQTLENARKMSIQQQARDKC